MRPSSVSAAPLFLLSSVVFPPACAVVGVPAERSASRAGPASSQSGEGPTLGYEDGFFVRSADGRNELVVEGLFQTVAGVFDGDRAVSSDFDLKRMRPELAGRVAETLRFKLEPNFAEDGVELEEAWVGLELSGGDALLMFGRMKSPFNLEEVRSRRHIDFPRFSILNQLAPAEDHGVFVNGRSPSGFWEYGFAAYNGTGTSDTNSSKDVAARLMGHPFVGRKDSCLRNLQIGIAGTWGRQDEDVGGDAIDNSLGLPVIRFGPGLRLDGTRWRGGLELAWFRGPWFLQSELIAMEQEMSSTTAEDDIFLRGAYVNLSRVLTGEAKTFKGVVPERPFDFNAWSGRGAWVLAARVSELRADDDLMKAGFAVPGAFTDRIHSASLGLNWIPNEHAIVRNSIVYSIYDDDVLLDEGNDDRELGALIELQFHF